MSLLRYVDMISHTLLHLTVPPCPPTCPLFIIPVLSFLILLYLPLLSASTDVHSHIQISTLTELHAHIYINTNPTNNNVHTNKPQCTHAQASENRIQLKMEIARLTEETLLLKAQVSAREGVRVREGYRESEREKESEGDGGK